MRAFKDTVVERSKLHESQLRAFQVISKSGTESLPVVVIQNGTDEGPGQERQCCPCNVSIQEEVDGPYHEYQDDGS